MRYAEILLLLVATAAVCDTPKPSVTLPCKIVNIVDGDTADVEVKFIVRVRFLDCWAPEKYTPEGKVSKARLTELVEQSTKDGVLVVPLPESGRLADVLTLDRVLGKLWIKGHEESLSEWMVKENLAKVKK